MLKKYHRFIGLVMLAPLCLWAVTGVIFIIKPGYDQAYQQLSVKTYPLTSSTVATPQHLVNSQQLHEVKQLNTILGEHLLVKNKQGWQVITPAKPPSNLDIERLISDATQHNKQRYGNIIDISHSGKDYRITTNTDVTLNLDWHSLTLRQRGQDTAFITDMYKLHYLQWSGNETIDGVIEIIGLSLLIILTLLGGWMCLANKSSD